MDGLAQKVVNRLTLIDSAFLAPGEITDTGDTCYNYACVLCHYGALMMAFQDAWAEGDGEGVGGYSSLTFTLTVVQNIASEHSGYSYR